MAVPWITVNDTMEPTSPVAVDAVMRASWLLFMLTGQKYTGIQTSTEMYSFDNSTDFKFMPAMYQGNIYNIPRMNNGTRRLRLRQTPVHEIISVVEHGKLVPSDTYTLRNNAYIVKNGGMFWYLDSPNELEVTYVHGSPPPDAGVSAAILLANEFILSEIDPEACTLPKRVTSITRQGISMTMLDTQEFLKEGLTGVEEVDLFIKAANPTRSLKKAKVFSPDRPRGERIN